MKTQYYTATSIDGFIATKDHSLEWLFSLGDPENSSYPDFIKDVGAIAMGSHTYEWVLNNHIRPGTDQAQPWPYEQPVWVFTSRSLPVPEDVPEGGLQFVRGDVAPVFAQIKARLSSDKNLWVTGGGELVGQFYDAGLLDELIIQIGSVILGDGMPLLPRAISPPLKLTSVSFMGSGFAELRYEVQRK
ncbi:MAG: dihydrofolate reductase family protein [Leptospiraceae bacterium]|nr:dihydrofolate reductase family protein [Leptospiraceae bacterium]